MGPQGLQAREGGEADAEVVLRLGGRVGLEGHEDGQAVEGGRDGLCGRGGRVLCGNEVADCPAIVSGRISEGSEGEGERVGLLVAIFGRRVDREPVRELGHVLRGDGQDMQEALIAPG